MEGDAPTTAITAMHALSDSVRPNLPRNITRNRETTLAPTPGPSFNLTTVTVSGETTVTVPTHLLLKMKMFLVKYDWMRENGRAKMGI